MSPKADAVIADGYGGDEVEAAEIARDAVDALLALHSEGVAILPDRQVRGLERWCPQCGGHMVIVDPWASDPEAENAALPCQCTEFGGLYRLVSVSEAPTRMEEP